MDTNRREETTPTPAEGGLWTSAPWVPATPGSSQQQQGLPISPNWQGNHPNGSNWLEPGLLTRVSQVTQDNVFKPARLPAEFLDFSVNGDFNIWQAGESAAALPLPSISTLQASKVDDSNIYGANLFTGKRCSISDSEPWSNMSFGSLLSMAHAGSNPPSIVQNEVTLIADFVSSSTTSAPRFHPEIGSKQQTTSIGMSLEPELDCPLGPSPTECSIPSRPFFDLNALPGLTANATLSEGISFQFEPITPQKTKQVEYRQETNLQNIMTNVESLERDTTENMPSGAAKAYQVKKQKKAVDQIRAAPFTPGQEKNKPDKGPEEPELIKTPQPRRRKHRPKVIIEGQTKSTPRQRGRPASVLKERTVKNKYAEDEENETGFNMDASTSKHTSAEKRKHARRKGINEQEATMEKRSTDSTDLNTTRLTRRSCRRSLNFTLEGHMNNCGVESQSENFKAKVVERNFIDVNFSHDLTHSTDQVEGYLSGPEKDSSGHIQNIERDPQPDYWFTAQKSTRGKCQIVFSDVTHDKEANTFEVTAGIHNQQTPQNYTISSSTTNFSEEREAKILKRRHTSTSAETEVCSSSATGNFNNFMERHLSLFSQNSFTSGMHFPNIYKKKRTEKVLGAANSSLRVMTVFGNQVKLGRNTRSLAQLFPSNSNQQSAIASKVTGLLINNHSKNGTQTGHRIVRDLLGHTVRVTRKRSRGCTRVRDLASLQELCKRLPSSPSRATISKTEHTNEIVCRPHTCLEALVADACSTMIKKKRSKRTLTFNLTGQTLFNNQGFGSTSNGTPLALTWKSMYSVNALINQLDRLDLNAQNSQILAQKQKAWACHMHYEEQSALVQYQGGGALIPFDDSFDQFRRKRPRPKVDLDDETTRVWKLLLEDINSEGIDGTDKDKTRWWEEERRVFKGRADSFIARMHLIQGDRRFSPWKGSVVDSVVGVFLTQNVSDHLSSSAFMSVAARFPPNLETDTAEYQEVGIHTEASLPEVCTLDADEPSGLSKEIVREALHGSDSEMPHGLQDDKVRLVNSLESSRKSIEHGITIDNLSAQLPDMSNGDTVMSHESAPNKFSSFISNGLDRDDAVSSQNSADSPIAQTNEITESNSLSNSEVIASEGKTDNFTSSTSFVKLLQIAGTVLHGVYREGLENKELYENQKVQPENLAPESQNEGQCIDHVSSHEPNLLCSEDTLFLTPSLGGDPVCLGTCDKYLKIPDTSSGRLCPTEISGLSVELASQNTLMNLAACSSQDEPTYFSPGHTSKNDKIEVNQSTSEKQMSQGETRSLLLENRQKKQNIPDVAEHSNNLIDNIESSSNIGSSRRLEQTEVKSDKNDPDYFSRSTSSGSRSKGGKIGKDKQNIVDWDSLRKQAEEGGRKRERTANTMDSVDWDAVRCADVNEIAQTIKERGMNNMLAERIKAFLNRLFQDHGSIDLEWLRDVNPDKAKEYLLSIRGLGLKSVECVRLLTLHHLAFPVDTNVGRIAVRLGWVPLQPLPESLQLHLLELYPVLESIQKYLWPRLCKLDQRTLYELHYQMITFGKVFCTKSKPNCNACPLRAECRHFASAFASARLALPTPEERSIVKVAENVEETQDPIREINTLQLPAILPTPNGINILSAAENTSGSQISVRSTNNLQLYSSHVNATEAKSGVMNTEPIIEEPTSPEPTIELPTTPEIECDIEDTLCEDPDEIPTINFNMEQFAQNLQKVMSYTETEEGDMSNALVALTPEAASIPVPKLKNMSRLRTEHQVYELPDSHPLLEGMDKREPDDPSPYLLAIWTPGETVDSIKPPERQCGSEKHGELCTDKTCLSCNSVREQKSQTVRGTLLIPCRTAMRGSFPLNGTYFQVNEVFSDHDSSMDPIDVPRQWLWNLPRRTVYFGTSIPTIFKGLTTAGIQYCFWRGFVCVRGFDRNTRAPRPLVARFHFPASKLVKGKGKIYDE